LLSESSPDIKISVITIVRNGDEFIEQTIMSVLAQTYKNLEYIVIDGLSTDGTVDIIKKHEAGIAFWKSERDEGIADAFNKGFLASKGDYILYLNADDKLADPSVVADFVAKIHEHHSPVMVYGDIDYMSRETEQIIRRCSIPFSPRALLKGQMIPHPGLFTHRRYFERYGKFDTSFRIAMDYEWLLRGALMERVVHVPTLVTFFRDGGVSNVNQEQVKDEIIAALKKNGFISSAFGEMKIRAYFYLRACAKAILNRVGLYKAFDVARNKSKVS
jgi:glycosyltransferase involved in cell wall biosynthesis